MKIVKLFLLLLLSIASIGIAVYSEIHPILGGATIGGLVAGITVPYLISSIIDMTDNVNWKSSQRKLNRAGILQPDTPIRISFAYLFRIKIDGKYFLVRNQRTNKYQPVGGAYKFFKDEADYLSCNIPVENDDRIPVDQITKRDYRLLVKNKDLREFVKRFNKTKYRENISDLSREFNEEILSTGIIDKKMFGSISYKYCGRHMTNVEYGKVFDHYELLLADIIELCLTEQQEECFRKLIPNKCEQYCFATHEEIKTLGVKLGTDELEDTIANHTYKILSENSDVLTRRKKHKNIVTVSLNYDSGIND